MSRHGAPGSRARLASATGLVLLALGAGGCASDADRSPRLTAVRARVLAATRDAVRALDDADLRVVEASGRFTSCGSDPGGTDEYRAGGSTATSDAPLADRVESATRALRSAGWRVTATGTSPTPYARLSRGGLRLGLDRTALRGSDALAFTVSGPCVGPQDGRETDYARTDRVVP